MHFLGFYQIRTLLRVCGTVAAAFKPSSVWLLLLCLCAQPLGQRDPVLRDGIVPALTVSLGVGLGYEVT